MERGYTWNGDKHEDGTYTGKEYTQKRDTELIQRRDKYGVGTHIESTYIKWGQTKRENIWRKDTRRVGKYTRSEDIHGK